MANKQISPEKRAEILAKKQAIKDAIAKRQKESKNQITDAEAKKYRKFRVTDSYKSLVKKIKDDMEETVNTQEAVDVAIEALQEAPAEQVVAACVEVLAGTIDVLQENVATLAEAVPEVPEEEVVEEEETKVEDSAKKIQDAIARAKAILKGKK